jgi:hypothetical protein
MIAKIFSKSSGSFRNRLRYIYGGSKHDHEISKIKTIEMNCLTADPLNGVNQNPIDILNEMIMEFDSVTALRHMSVDSDRMIKPVFHAVLSLRPGESLTAGQWAEAVCTYITDLGFSGDNKYVAVMHQDKEHQHVHIVANRVVLNHGFTLVSDKNERYKSLEAAAKLEERFGLSKAPRPIDTWGTSYSLGEVISAHRDGTIPTKAKMIAKIAGAIEKTVSEHGDMFVFVRYLRQQKVYVHLSIRADGQPSGIAYEFDGTIISGRKLKRSRLTFQRLITQECIFYDSTTILELEAEIAKRDHTHQRWTRERYLYFRFTSKTKKFNIKFQPKTLSEREIEAIVEAILMFLAILFGLRFESKKEKERREAHYVEYFPELALSKEMFDPDVNYRTREVRSVDQNNLSR